MKIHFDSIVVDGHNDTMMKIIDENTWLPSIDIGKSTTNHIDIPKLKKGGLNVPLFAAYTDGYYGNTPKNISKVLAMINALYWTESNNFDVFEIANSASDIYQIVDQNKIAAVPTIEGAYSIDKNNAIELLRQYYDLGIKVIGFTWNFSNELGEGVKGVYGDVSETTSHKGLTKLGKEVAKEMNRLGMVIDVSHMSEASFWDIIRISEAPILASHSGIYSLKSHSRNLKDEQLKALAKNGGVIGIVFYHNFLTNSEDANVKDIVDHIDYVVKLVGVDHVGLGSDFDGATLPKDLKDSSELYKVTEELVNRGYSSEDIGKILGKNMLRVLKEVEELADNHVNNLNLGIFIKPEYSMGEIILDLKPFLSAKIESEDYDVVNKLNYRIIVDGIPYKAIYDGETSTLYYGIGKPLKERFHVVTFEASNNNGETYRKTRIFYIK